MEAIAKTKNLKGSPRKARLVIDLIRGRNVSQALAILKFTDKRAAEPITKTLRSAIANATYLAEKQNIAIDPDELFVKTCFVDMGTHKNRRRMRPAPQGRAYRETRHYCHITILVSSDKPPVVEFVKKPVVKKAEVAEKKAKTPKKADSAKEAKKAQVEEVLSPPEEVIETKGTETTEAVNAEVAETIEVVSETPAVETNPADETQIEKNEESE